MPLQITGTSSCGNVMLSAEFIGQGYTIFFNDHRERRVYIPQWVMNIEPKSWKHAKNLFNKYLREDVKFNNAQ